MHMTKKEIFSIPNIMGYFRLILAPVYLVLYFHAKDTRGYMLAAAVLAVSALTDMLDGKIARRFNMVTELGKILDPVADKVTHGAVALSLSFRFPLMCYVLILFLVKETFMGVMGLYVMKRRGRMMDGAQWYGKLCTAVLFVLLLALLLNMNISWFRAGLLCVLCIAVMLFSLGCYVVFYARLLRGVPPEKNKISIRRTAVTAALSLAVLLVYDVSAALIAYGRQPELSLEQKKRIEEEFADWNGDAAYAESGTFADHGDAGGTAADRSADTSVSPTGEYAAVIEDNGQALLERVRLIGEAKERVILSTFDFHSDSSGRVMIGALLDAAERDVQVQVLVDGFDYWISMEWNPYFYALASHKNVEVRVYNRVSPLAPWRSMGRLHDKYLIADDDAYLLGGRNTYDYFLGDTAGHRNYDRDMLVQCREAGQDSSLARLKEYFEGVWNGGQCRTVHDRAGLADRLCVRRARETIDEDYARYIAEQGERLTEEDFATEVYPVERIALISNPIHTGVKEPLAWHALMTMMSQAKERVKIHTPYIICNEMMYDSLTELCGLVPNVLLMTNSVANNGNPFGASDYAANKQKILDTGLEVWEYEGGYSYHGKSILIDDDISIVGSFNMDMRSVYLDTELMLVIKSEEINRQLGGEMERYERAARCALTTGTGENAYENPYGVVPVTLTPKRKLRIWLVHTFGSWARFLF